MTEITLSEILNESSVHEVLWKNGEIEAIILNFMPDDKPSTQLHLVPNGDTMVILDYYGEEIVSEGKIRGEHLVEQN